MLISYIASPAHRQSVYSTQSRPPLENGRLRTASVILDRDRGTGVWLSAEQFRMTENNRTRVLFRSR
eukprot:4806346-Pleurochrysis_carterae.AAC.1